MAARPGVMQMTQAQWLTWANKRKVDAQKIAKVYERQAREVEAMVADRGCSCNPMIVLKPGEAGGPVVKTPLVTHSMDCSWLSK